ncbi:MAG: hypothetical protein L3K24_10890 [Gammaproteobacteria bacterium]|nr:hypothetical protein [Gammaproteobacteria bacterium]
MKNMNLVTGILFLLLTCTSIYASDKRELDTTIIKGNKEAPQILYMVPWQETKTSTKKEEQKLVLHSLFGDLFDPILPEKLDQKMENE